MVSWGVEPLKPKCSAGIQMTRVVKKIGTNRAAEGGPIMERSNPRIEIGPMTERLTVVARFLLRYGLVVIILWFGTFKPC